MPATFTINQTGIPAGLPDRSRQDIIPGGPLVEFTADSPPPTHTTYKWEFLAQPSGVAVSFSDPYIYNPTVDFGTNYGGYLIRLTVDEGLVTEDVAVRAVYLKWPISNKALPALTETNQDNSQSPFNGYRGWEEKILDYLWWIEQNISGSVTPMVTPHHYIYVDEYNGDDTFGTGEINKPYATLQHAATTVPDPTDTLDFYFPIHFVLNPGRYPGKVVLPGKRAFYVIEAPGGASIDNDVDWNVDPDWWALYGLPSFNFASLVMVGNLGADSPSDGFPPLIHNGKLSVRNSNPGGGNPMVGVKYLFARGVHWQNGGIRNQASGTATPDGATGTLTAYFDHCRVAAGGAQEGIFGEREAITGLDWLPNLISVSADNSHLDAFYGSVVFRSLRNCTIDSVNCNLDWDLNPISGFVAGGNSPGFQKCIIRTIVGGHDGVDTQAPDAPALWFDSYTWDHLGGTPTLTNMDSDSPGNRGYNFSENDRGIDVDSSAFVNNLGPPGTLTILSEVLARIDSLVLGTYIPTGKGRIYVDAFNGDDGTGDGTIGKPFATLEAACASVTPTTNPVEFLTPYEFIIAPGVDASSGPIVVPPRRRVTFSGRDVIVTQPIQWFMDPDWWSNCALAPDDHLPQLLFDGEHPGTRAESFRVSVPDTFERPTFFLLSGIAAKNINPTGGGGGWVGGHTLHLDGVSTTSIANLASGGAGPATYEATQRMYVRMMRTFVGGQITGTVDGFIGSEKEPLIPDEHNLVYISGTDSYIGGIYAHAFLQGFDNCFIRAISRLADISGGITDGYITCAPFEEGTRPVFRNCQLAVSGQPYVFGWDGASGPTDPDGPTFDSVSYRSILEAEKAGSVLIIDNVSAPAKEVAVGEAPSRIQLVAGDIGVPGRDLVLYGHVSAATAFPIDMSSLSPLIKDGDFLHPVGGGTQAQVQIVRSGRYRFEFTAALQNNQILWDNVVAVGVWYNGAHLTQYDTFSFMQAAAPGAPTRGTSVVTSFDGVLSSGDIVEVRAWLASNFYGSAPVYLIREGTLGWLERVE